MKDQQYMVAIVTLDDQMIEVTRCKTRKDLSILLGNIDSEKFKIVRIDIIDAPVEEDYSIYLETTEDLEIGNTQEDK